MSEQDYQEILQDLPRRRRVWDAISDLGYDPSWMDYVVRTCRESGYSWEELDHIARYEVAPATWFSWDYLFPKAGVSFDMFVDEEWLVERILKLVRRRHHALWVKLLGRYMMSIMKEKWREVERRFKSGDDGADDGAVAPAGLPRGSE